MDPCGTPVATHLCEDNHTVEREREREREKKRKNTGVETQKKCVCEREYTNKNVYHCDGYWRFSCLRFGVQ